MKKFLNPLNYIRHFIRILFFYTNKNLFHCVIPKYFKDGTVTSHIFGGSTDIAFQKSIRDSKKEFIHPLLIPKVFNSGSDYNKPKFILINEKGDIIET